MENFSVLLDLETFAGCFLLPAVDLGAAAPRVSGLVLSCGVGQDLLLILKLNQIPHEFKR